MANKIVKFIGTAADDNNYYTGQSLSSPRFYLELRLGGFGSDTSYIIYYNVCICVYFSVFFFFLKTYQEQECRLGDPTGSVKLTGAARAAAGGAGG